MNARRRKPRYSGKSRSRLEDRQGAVAVPEAVPEMTPPVPVLYFPDAVPLKPKGAVHVPIPWGALPEMDPLQLPPDRVWVIVSDAAFEPVKVLVPPAYAVSNIPVTLPPTDHVWGTPVALDP